MPKWNEHLMTFCQWQIWTGFSSIVKPFYWHQKKTKHFNSMAWSITSKAADKSSKTNVTMDPLSSFRNVTMNFQQGGFCWMRSVISRLVRAMQVIILHILLVACFYFFCKFRNKMNVRYRVVYFISSFSILKFLLQTREHLWFARWLLINSHYQWYFFKVT